MDTETKSPSRVESAIEEGAWFVLDDYAMRKDILPRIEDVFLEGIEKLEGRACREAVQSSGLALVHRHFPVEKVLLLERHLHLALAEELYYWSYRVGRDDLGITNEFFVDNLIMFRIHYPYAIARKAKGVVSPGIDWPDKIRSGLADLRSLHMIRNRLSDFWHRQVGDWLGFRDPAQRYDAPKYYHKGLPEPARSHGPHVDTWYGHSYDGINLWLSVAGVNRDNTVILYPELFGHPVDYDPRSMYLAAGIPLPAPLKVELDPGQLLLFNPEMLHGTQVNVSDETRFAITTRLNPRQPRFNPKADFHFQHWHSSEDLAARRLRRIRVFPKTKYRGEPSVPARKTPWIARRAVLRSSERLQPGTGVAVCPSSAVAMGDKLAVDLANAKLLLVRSTSGLHALSRVCPHMGIDLIDGAHDDDQVFCPGHGVAYSLEDGRARCPMFALKSYPVTEVDGMIVVEAPARSGAAEREETSG